MFITWSKLLDVLNNGMPDLSRVEIRYSGEVLELRHPRHVGAYATYPTEPTFILRKSVARTFVVIVPEMCTKDEFFKLMGEVHQLILVEVGSMAPRDLEANFRFNLIGCGGAPIG